MARRKGSGRGKSTVNSRRPPVENARSSLKDEIVSGSTRKSQQKQQPNNDMEAATTTPTTTKHFNKTKFPSNQRRNNVAALTTTTKKQTNNNNSNNNANNLQTYRSNHVDAGGSNESNSNNTMKSQRQTGKQGRAAKASAAAAATAAAAAAATAATAATGGKEAKEQKTAAKATTTTNGQPIKADLVSNNNNTAITSSSNSNVNSDNSNSLVVNKQQQQHQQTQYEINKTKTQIISTNDTGKMPPETPAANATLDADDDSWSNSKYLHKKFKRLASTTETEGNAAPVDESNSDVASKTRTTSLSSASSSVSSPPPLPLQLPQPPPTTMQSALTNGYHAVSEAAAAVHSANAHTPPISAVNAIVKSSNHKDHNTTYSFSGDISSNSALLATSAMSGNSNQQPHLQRLEAAVSDIAAESSSHAVDMAQQQMNAAGAASTAASGGRHVCPYCNLICTKPSVLQKHIRAHTNERPFPCDICKIAFKTKSNYYKHCRSRSHAARCGFEVPADADDGFSDQEGDPELSNSSSEVISRSGSPIDERSLTSPTMLAAHMPQQHLQQPIALSHTHSPTPSPSTLSATKTTYLQQHQPHQLPLGSPAAGTLPPTATTATMPQQNSSVQSKQQNLDFKPYKPKFHNAAMYATTKESNSGKQSAQTALTGKASINEQQQQQQQQQQQHVMAAAHLTALQQQQQPHAVAAHPPPTPPHHASLSPSTHMKLNNHLNAQHQLQMQQQHVLAPPPPPSAANSTGNAIAMPTPTPGVYYLGQPPSAAAIMHPGAAAAHLQQQYYDPVVAAVAHQQALAFQFQMQHHLQQQQQQHLQLQYQQEQQRQIAPSAPVTTVIKPHATPASLVTAASTTAGQTRVHKSGSSHILPNGVAATTAAGSSHNSATAGLLHGGVAAVASSGGGVHLNKEFLQEHISKLISQNEAIVENKELLLQKKYPKTLNRSRSFNNSNNAVSNSNSPANNNSNLVTTTTVNSESANAKLAQAIAQKKQLQMQQQQQTIVQQQQQHAQYQQHHHPAQRLDEPSMTQQQHFPINGLSKQLHSSAKQHPPSAAMQQQYRQQHSQPQPAQHISQSLQLQAQHLAKEVLPMSLASQAPCHISPLNLSAKSTKVKEATPPASSPAPTMPTSAPPTPKKRQSIEHQTSTSSETSTNSTASVSSNNVNNASNANKHPQNTSIIKNLLLNARGLAQPTGEGEHAVYICPLCSLEFRTAEDLQTHTGSNCHGALNSAPITPVASPSHKYFRSVLNPLSLAKLAWSQLKTKPSNGVLNRLSASQASSSSAKTTTTTTTANSASTAPSSSATLTVEHPLRLIDTPLPSPGPLLGKTPLVDSYNNSEVQRKTEGDVIITKMHDHFSTDHLPTTTKRARFELSTSECFTLAPPPSGLLMTANKKGSNLSGGDIQLITTATSLADNKKDERIKRFTSSGGSMIPISECSDLDKSPKLIRTPLLSGGSFQEVSPKKDKADKAERLTIAPPSIGGLTNVLGLPNSSGPQHFQFPPINSITAFNPLTLPPLQTRPTAEKVIPYVPGIPGPNTPHTPLLPPPPQQLQLPQLAPRNISPGRKSATSALTQTPADVNPKELKNLSPFGGVQNVPSEFNRIPPSPALRTVRNWAPNSNLNKTSALEVPKKSFNFQRIADNLSPRKGSSNQPTKSSAPEQERRHFNFEAMAKEHELNIQTSPAGRGGVITTAALMPLHVDTSAAASTPSELAPAVATATTPGDLEAKKSKFLRPTSLPLKPGTFTPKRHHGITPTANTLPLISPETPRPSKSCVQLYLNGHAYTYLGLKSSTKMFYCTVNCPQPSYVAGMHKLSMYSVWQTCAENNPHPLGLKPREVMSLYDSRQKNLTATMAETAKTPYRLVTSQQTVMTPFPDSAGQYYHHQIKQIAIDDASSPEATGHAKREFNEHAALKKDSTQSLGASSAASTTASQLVGGYESHEDYTYIRGRGRGRYVCSECGIRCKKPSMLKKHIRTHTDVRPYTCKNCNFSFKTKGNLTKHMQSKTHYKKCIELGINPGPMPADGEFEAEVDCDQQSTTSAGGRTSSIPDCESDSDDFSENESESSDTDESKSRLQEHEAARCLLSLSMTPPIAPSVSPQLKSEAAASYGSQVFSMEQTTAVFAPASTPATTHPSAIKRVVSFTQPKPPFDYQKQEQYYSNPEESKPKRSANTASTTFESAPIDLTKPRSSAPSPAALVSREPSCKPAPPTTPTLDMVSIPGPVQTKAQIRDVIFGKSSNESGFLKTVISVSDKVRSASENAEAAKNMNENVLLEAYLKEQALQNHRRKQSQMNRNSFPPPEANDALHQHQFATTPTATVASAGLSAATSTTHSNALTATSPVVMHSIPAPMLKDEFVCKSSELKEQTPRIVPAIPEPHAAFLHEAPTAVRPKQDDVEGTLSASDSESGVATKPTKIKAASPASESYNANLPAAVHQPGTTDFSGVLLAQPRTVTVGENGFKKNTANEIQPAFPRSIPVAPEVGKPTCSVCGKSFQKQSQLTLHMNIHYIERKFKCEPCGVPFRTQGHLQKHERSEQHKSKVALNSTFGKPSTSNPRPFECTDCVIAFRIHGHLAKHLRSKGHVQKLECLLKLPIGTYAEIERAGINLGVIDTSDCENSLISLKKLADELMQKDPNKQSSYTLQSGMGASDNNSNTGIGSQDSASEDDGFSAAASAAASAIASLENDSPNDTPRRANSTSEDDSIGFAGLKRRLPNSFSQGEESDNPSESLEKKRARKAEKPPPTAPAAVPTSAEPSVNAANTPSNNAAN